MPCCTDHLSLMAGTYGSVRLSLVLTEQLRLTLIGLKIYSPKVVAGVGNKPSSESERRLVAKVNGTLRDRIPWRPPLGGLPGRPPLGGLPWRPPLGGLHVGMGLLLS